MSGVYNKLNAGFSGCVDTMKAGVEAEAAEAEQSLATCLELWARCADQVSRPPVSARSLQKYFLDTKIFVAVKESAMLLRRTCLMLDWENSCRLVDKARPNREEAAKGIR